MGTAASASSFPQVSPSSSAYFLELTGGRAPLHIPAVEHRGINLSQLLALGSFIKKVQQDVAYDAVNLYDLRKHLIKPLTLTDECSYVEAVAENVDLQMPEWFVSHWWGEPVLKFIGCVEVHAKARGVQSYWVCAYANNQHELGKDLGSDPRQSSFFKAMAISAGVLLILDQAGPATPFERIWCCFEQSVSVREASLLLDIATMQDLDVQLLTEGLTNEEEFLEEEYKQCPYGTSGWALKSEREAAFPLELIKKALQIDIRNASASRQIDKTRILNSIVGISHEHLDEEPSSAILEDPIFEEVNNALRGIFAVAAWRKAVESSLDISDASSLQLARALREDIRRETLKLNLALCVDFKDTEAQMLASSFPLRLRDVALDFSGCESLSSVTGLALGLSALSCLSVLKLDLAGCVSLTSIDDLGTCLTNLSKLVIFDLSLARCTSLVNWSAFTRGLASRTSLTCLQLDLSNCVGLTTLADVSKAVQRLLSLEALKFNFAYCSEIAQVDELGVGLSSLTNLKTLELNFEGCTKLRSLCGISTGFSRLRSLATLVVSFLNCCALANILDLGQGLGSIASGSALTSLDLNFHGSRGLASGVEELGSALATMRGLEKLVLNFWGCSQILSIEAIGIGLCSLKALRAARICFRYCERLVEGATLYEGLACLKCVQGLFLDFSYCNAVVALPEFGKAIGKLSCVSSLTLLFKGITTNACVYQLSTGLAQLTQLEELDIDFAYSTLFSDIKGFGYGFKNLVNLVKLYLRFNDCPIETIENLSCGIADLAALQKLILRLDNTRVNNVDCLGKCITNLQALTNFELDLEGNTGLSSIDAIAQGISKLNIVENLKMNCKDCSGLASISEFGQYLIAHPGLSVVELAFHGCHRLPETLQVWFSSSRALALALAAAPATVSHVKT